MTNNELTHDGSANPPTVGAIDNNSSTSARATSDKATPDREMNEAWTAEAWAAAKDIVDRALSSGLQCSIASLNEDGSPHVKPIGSLDLTSPGRGHYFELFASQLRKNLERDPRFTLLAVDSSPSFWLSSLAEGEFSQPPGLRLTGIAGSRRESTDTEVAAFRRRTDPVRGLAGHDLLWGKLSLVRELYFQAAVPIRFGPMTSRAG